MKCISVDREYSLHEGSLLIHDKLPAQPYYLRFQKMKGFYFEAQDEIDIKEDKIYGIHNEKIKKVLNGFERVNRNFGVILSGHKGIGKSLFAKLLSKTAIENGYPVIIVDKYIPGMSSVIEDIKQEVIILFDEFDKTFANIKAADGEASPQDTLLSMFDGLSNGKKLFVITCNDLSNLSDYLINRPGRFHYHFRFDFPTLEEIDEYMRDKLESAYYKEIDKVKQFATKVDLNFDCLRAITFELNTGIPFEEAIGDLNIMNMKSGRYNLTLYFTDGTIMTSRGRSLDLFDKVNREYITFYDNNGRSIGIVDFIPGNCKYDVNIGGNILLGKEISYEANDNYDEDEDYQEMCELVPKYMIIERQEERNLHYMV